jgi:hypothetical protein
VTIFHARQLQLFGAGHFDTEQLTARNFHWQPTGTIDRAPARCHHAQNAFLLAHVIKTVQYIVTDVPD